MRFLQNIKVRITLWYLLMVALLVALSGVLGYVLLLIGLSRNTVNPWDMRMADVASLPDGTGTVSGFITVTGRIGADEGYNMILMPLSSLLESAAEDETVEIGTPGGKPIIVDKGLLIGSNAPLVGRMWVYVFTSSGDPTDRKLVVAAQSERGLASTLGMFRQTILVSAVVTLVIAGVLGFFLVRRMLWPLQTITQTARNASGRGMKGRLKIDRQDELGELASTMNQMFDRVEKALDDERQVASELSHELRTPLAIAQAEASLALTKGRSDREYQKALETVSREISYLSSVTNRLLFLAWTEHGSRLETAELDLKDILAELASGAEALCQNKRIAFENHVSDATGKYMMEGDEVRIREVFLNLIDNAIRYTPEGGTISLSLGREGHTGGDGFGEFTTGACATVTVSDTGAGIAEENIPRLFERFYRAGRPTGDQSGTGLGLAICKRIAELHGGKIEVKSKLAEGSTFTVTLPLKENRPDSTAANQQPLRQPSS